MRTFLCEVDHLGSAGSSPANSIPVDDLRHMAMGAPRCSAWLFWTLLTDVDAEDSRADVDAGRHAEACRLLSNRAVDFISRGPAAFEVRGAR